MMMRSALVALMLFAFWHPVKAHEDPEISGYVQVEGGRIWYRLNGSEHLGRMPAIIVAHGGPGGTHRGNLPYVALADKYPVILYDQLGTGNSDRPEGQETWRVQRFVDEIDHIRNALGLDEVIMAGHSWGGTLAAEYAVRNPDGLAGAILSSPLISTPIWNADNAEWIKDLPKETQAVLNRHKNDKTMASKEYREAAQQFYDRHMCRVGHCNDNGHRAGGPAGNEDMYLTMWGPTDFFGIGTLKDYDLTPRLDDIEVPTLILCGEFDEAAPKSCNKFGGMIDDAKVTILPNAGHASMAADEAYYIQQVRAFADRVSR